MLVISLTDSSLKWTHGDVRKGTSYVVETGDCGPWDIGLHSVMYIELQLTTSKQWSGEDVFITLERKSSVNAFWLIQWILLHFLSGIYANYFSWVML